MAAGGTFSVDVPAALAEGAFSVVATGHTLPAILLLPTTLARSTLQHRLTVDAPALTNDATPTITGTTNLPAGSVSLLTDALGASQTVSATVAGGTFSVDLQHWPKAAHSSLPATARVQTTPARSTSPLRRSP
ncbi:hypothetical protein FSC37_05390 [Piscinibacter aquaticus]|uniref:Bacterial Ig-like domain-containing protein n=1 Tax=Piscinibacter aquaticus TaxID=392597 RepID=A0A5C6TYG5_9BURK|nr:hypothetical protein FSC37_05390 [Piscinibacter aquaticus]